MRRLLILLAAATVLVAGCGGGGTAKQSLPLTKAQYQAKLEEIANDIKSNIGVASKANKKISKDDVAKVVKATHTFVAQLQDVQPPADVKVLHAELIAAMTEFAGDFPGIADKLNVAKDPGAVFAAVLGAPSVQKLAKLQKDFKAKGYTLNLNG